MDARLMQKLLADLQKSKQILDQKRRDLEETEFVATAGGGLCEVVMNGKHEIIRCTLDDKVMGDKDTVQDLVVTAVNQVLSRINEEMAKLQKEMKSFFPSGMV